MIKRPVCSACCVALPPDWLTGEGKAAGAKFGGASGSRRALAWYPENGMASTNISLIITNIGAVRFMSTPMLCSASDDISTKP